MNWKFLEHSKPTMQERFVATLFYIAALVMGAIAIGTAIMPAPAHAQQTSCFATSAAPTYTNNTLSKLSCDLSGNLRAATGSGTLAQQVQGNSPSGAADVGNPVKTGCVYNSTLTGVSSGQRVDCQAGSGGRMMVSAGDTGGATDGFSNLAIFSLYGRNASAGSLYFPTAVANSIFNGTSWDRMWSGGVTGMTGVNVQATPSGGAMPFKLIAANTNNSTLVSTGAHTLYSAEISNNSAALAYLKIYDKATAPTCGTDTPIKTVMFPASTTVDLTFGDSGIALSLGLGICAVTGIADADNTAVAATTYAINLEYK